MYTAKELDRARRVVASLRQTQGLSPAELASRAAKIAEMEREYGLEQEDAAQPEPDAQPAKPKRGRARPHAPNQPNSPPPDDERAPLNSGNPKDYHYNPVVPYRGRLHLRPPQVVWHPAMVPLVRAYQTPAQRQQAALAAKAARGTLAQRLRRLPVTGPAWLRLCRDRMVSAWRAAGKAMAAEEDEQ